MLLLHGPPSPAVTGKADETTKDSSKILQCIELAFGTYSVRLSIVSGDEWQQLPEVQNHTEPVCSQSTPWGGCYHTDVLEVLLHKKH